MDETRALTALKRAQHDRRSQSSTGDSPARHSAATAHNENDVYMATFEAALENMRVSDSSGDGSIRHRASSQASEKQTSALQTASSRRTVAPSTCQPRYSSQVVAGWQIGPVSKRGVLVELSDRPALCSAADWDRQEVVVGSADHALYVVDIRQGKRARTLYTKTCGHTEWVTAVAYCSGGKILSGGMDGKLWLWPAGSSRGCQMEGHAGPVSKVRYDTRRQLAITSSYDKTIKQWDVTGLRGTCRASLTGHIAPVLEMDVMPTTGAIASGDRSGTVMVWDAEIGTSSWSARGAHVGHVTALTWSGESAVGESYVFISGGQDGCVRVWDTRSGPHPVASKTLHVNSAGKGAVGDIVADCAATRGMVVTTGADQALQVLDPSNSYAPLGQVQLPDFPYSLTAAGGLALAGCGDGSLTVVNIADVHVLYALGANRAAVRTMCATTNKLVCAGDDGDVLIYSFI